MTTTLPPSTPDGELVVREGHYGAKVAAVEPGGAEFVPVDERHGRPRDLFWTWMSPNLEFATIFLGVLGVGILGLSFWQAVAAIVLGSALGSLTHAVLSARGPAYGVPQMILSRAPFGFLGNALPAGLNAVTAGIGWFAVNSVSGALALGSLTGLPNALCLVLVVIAQLAVAFLGHNMVHAFERIAFPLLAVVFAVSTVVILTKSHPGAASTSHAGIGGFLVLLGATFGYAAGWIPYAADYTRYLPAGTPGRKVGLSAGLGVFVSCVVLETAGAASSTIGGTGTGSPTSQFTAHLPSLLANLTLLSIAVGAVCANAINIYSGSMSFLAMGVQLPLALRRAIVAIGFGAIGFVLALTSLDDAGAKYENFLLIIAYWIGPWLGVFLTDQRLRAAWHPVALSSEVTGRETQVRLLGQPYRLRRDTGTRDSGIGCTPPVAAVAERWGLVWVAPDEPAVPLFDEPDAEDETFVGAWLPPARTPAPAGFVADNFLDVAHFPFVHAATFGAAEQRYVEPYDVAIEPGGFRSTQVQWFDNPNDPGVLAGERPVRQRRRATYVYRAPFQLLLRLEELDAGAVKTILFCVQPEAERSTRIYTKMLLHGIGGQQRPDQATVAAEVAFEQAVLAEDLALQETLTVPVLPLDLRSEMHVRADRLGVALRRALRELVGAREP